jgi:predicted dehydrogenase
MRYHDVMQSNEQALPVAVVGVGRMGRHHARTYHQLNSTQLLAVVDFDLSRAESLAKEYHCQAFASVEDLLANHPQLQAATVAVPTQHHSAAAMPLMDTGVSCLIEKPIAGSSEEAKALTEHAERCGCVLQVGHTERFNPAVRALSTMKLKPRFIEVARLSPMTFRSLDVGVVMDMMIHDLDIVISLVNRPLVDVQAVGATLLGEHEDVCDARLTFEGGCVVTMKGSRMATGTERWMRFFADEAYVTLDYGSREGAVLRLSDHAEKLAELRGRLANGEDLSDVSYVDLLKPAPLSIDLPTDEQDQLTAQAKAFVHAIRTGTSPVVTAAHGGAAVEAAERIVAAMQQTHSR